VRRICSPGYDGRRAHGASGRARALGWLLGPLLLVLPALASGQIDTADPLEVPTGAEPVLADRLDSPERRIEAAIAGFRERGYQELPVLAAAALQSQGSAAEERALEAAPSIPAVRYEVGRRSSNPVEVARAIGSTLGNLPSLVWLASWVGAALGLGLLACTAGLVALGLARSIGLHGHWVGHLAWDRDPPAWPGGLILASLLVLLPLLGVGPMLLVALAGALAAFRLTRREGLWIGSALLVSGLLLGPALPLWARLATLRAHDPAVLSAWRIEIASSPSWPSFRRGCGPSWPRMPATCTAPSCWRAGRFATRPWPSRPPPAPTRRRACSTTCRRRTAAAFASRTRGACSAPHASSTRIS
jgi:hypothetical protein